MIKIKQREEFPSCHDHTLLKRAAKGGGGPYGEGQCLGCSVLQKRGVEAEDDPSCWHLAEHQR